MSIVAAVVVILFAIRIILPSSTPRIRRRRTDGGARSESIALLEKVRLGASDQWILERSEDVSNPIILFLHGGPGTSQLTANRRTTRTLEKYFIVVNWDQRGAGKSFNAITDTGRMNIDQFIQDTRELTLYLLKKFSKQKIVLAGHSWGSVIGALTASKYPELYYCYVGIGQVANMARNEMHSYCWTLERARERQNRRAVNALEKMGPPPYTGNWHAKTIAERQYLARFGGEVYESGSGAMKFVLGSLLFSREYSLVDRVNVFRGIFGSMKLLWPELMTVDLFKRVPELNVPVFFMEGRFDQEASSAIAAEYFEALKAPSKELIWFERSAHLPNSEERQLFNRLLVEKVRPIAAGTYVEKPFN